MKRQQIRRRFGILLLVVFILVAPSRLFANDNPEAPPIPIDSGVVVLYCISR